ncbi:MAG: hypothetical protein AAGE03_15890, partial [Pseudomonadota bacterium]
MLTLLPRQVGRLRPPACPQPLAAVSTGKSREAVMADDKPRKKKGNIVVWVILGLLILSLG